MASARRVWRRQRGSQSGLFVFIEMQQICLPLGGGGEGDAGAREETHREERLSDQETRGRDEWPWAKVLPSRTTISGNRKNAPLATEALGRMNRRPAGGSCKRAGQVYVGRVLLLLTSARSASEFLELAIAHCSVAPHGERPDPIRILLQSTTADHKRDAPSGLERFLGAERGPISW